MIIPEISQYDTLISYLEDQGLFSFMIAGGAIRDVIFDKEINDIDVFYLPQDQEVLLNKIVEFIPYPDQDFTLTHKFLWNLNGVIKEVQLIRINKNIQTWIELLNTFPTSISQVCKTKFEIFYTPTFQKALEEKTIEFDTHIKYNAYISKICNKYRSSDGWSWWGKENFVVPHGSNEQQESFQDLILSLKKKLKTKSTIKYKVLNHPQQIEREFY